MALIAGATIVGAGLDASSSKKASKAAASSARQAAELQQQRYMMTRADLSPYNMTGQGALGGLLDIATGSPTGGGPDYVAMADANRPGQMTQAELEATPGYQFTREQGLKAVQSSAAARGLGVSGAALKGAATYATGLADNTYKTQFDIAQKRFEDINTLNTAQQGNLTNTFNRLYKVGELGENAAAQTGTTGATLANQAGNALISAGSADAAGIKGVGNALTNGINNAIQNYQYAQNRGGPTNMGGVDQGTWGA